MYTRDMETTLRKLREQNNYSQAAVASSLGISRQMYIKYENGESVPSVKVIKELSDFYRVPYDVIIEDKLNKNETIKETPDIYEQEEGYGALEVHFTEPEYGSQEKSASYYLESILKMLPKLVYKEQLVVLENLCGMVQTETQQKMKTKKQKSAYERLMELGNKYHGKSDGTKWTREEIYER